jgi:hypothetical protein
MSADIPFLTANNSKLASFGESPLVRGIGTFRNSAHQNGPMGSFGKTDFREMSPDYATHSPELANGFVWENGHWLRFVRGAGPLCGSGQGVHGFELSKNRRRSQRSRDVLGLGPLGATGSDRSEDQSQPGKVATVSRTAGVGLRLTSSGVAAIASRESFEGGSRRREGQRHRARTP